ncbi:NBS-LRR type resistance protein [Cucumis melo var. makuwa]|uniref:NBS-LRR type resistance protein n=1 Tax=Cucumis melo var. makuwa TaxID=1194695 RepID=A0A5A7SNC1_CUCMM|nr:NBS-LRR type resistance protein [Cucumis melo var. makuwa]
MHSGSDKKTRRVHMAFTHPSCLSSSSGPVERTYQSSAPEGCTYQSSAPEGCTYQSSAPEGGTYQSSAPGGNTYQSSAPEGCTYQSSAPEGCTYPYSVPSLPCNLLWITTVSAWTRGPVVGKPLPDTRLCPSIESTLNRSTQEKEAISNQACRGTRELKRQLCTTFKGEK